MIIIGKNNFEELIDPLSIPQVSVHSVHFYVFQYLK